MKKLGSKSHHQEALPAEALVRLGLDAFERASVQAVDRIPLHVIRGWRSKEDRPETLVGYYRTPYGAWRGMIARKYGFIEPFICEPPNALIELHPDRIALWRRQNNWRYIHLRRQPVNGKVDGVIDNG